MNTLLSMLRALMLGLLLGSPASAAGFFMNQQGYDAIHSDPISFSPASIPDLTLWLIGDDVPGSDGAAVPSWPAHSPTTISASQGTVAAQPSLQVAEIAGHNAVLGDSVNDALALSASISTAGSWTVVSVQKRLSSGGLGGSIGALASTAFVGPPFAAIEYGSISRTYLASRTDQKYATINSQAWHVLTSQDNAGTLVLRVDGSVQSLTAAPDTGTGNFDRLFVRSGSVINEYWGTYIAEIVAYTRALNSTELSELETYFKTKYGTP
jgi:hypothetical protein